MECAPLPNVRISSSVSFYCENKSRCSCPFWMALCKRRHGGIPILERTSPIDFDSFFDTGHPSAHCARSARLPLVISNTSRTSLIPRRRSAGTCISCVLTTGPSASSLNTFKNNSLLQSFPPHNICSKCSPFLMYLVPCSVANDHSRALLTSYKVAFNCFIFFLYLSLPLALSTYKFFYFHIIYPQRTEGCCQPCFPKPHRSEELQGPAQKSW